MGYLGFFMWVIGCAMVGMALGRSNKEAIIGSIGIGLAISGALIFWGLG